MTGPRIQLLIDGELVPGGGALCAPSIRLGSRRLATACRDRQCQRRHVVFRRRTVRVYKQSGFGREMGLAGFEEYLQTKVMAAAVQGTER